MYLVGYGKYVLSDGQVWADPDVEYTAWYMRRLSQVISYVHDLGECGTHLICTKFSPESVAQHYSKRLNELHLV